MKITVINKASVVNTPRMCPWVVDAPEEKR
jgi:hypothetical protein